MSQPSPTRTAVPLLLAGLAILTAVHTVVYMALSGDARSAIGELETTYDVAELESAPKPGEAPAAGSADYSPWLRSYERWHAAGEYQVHARQEGLVRGGMLLSFLMGLGMLVHGFWITTRTPRRRATDRPTRRGAHRPRRAAARPAPARPVRVRPVTPQRPRRPRPAVARAPRRARRSA